MGKIDLNTAKAYLNKLAYKNCNRNEQAEYIQAHLSRIFETFNIIEKQNLGTGSEVLDVGAKPYMLAALVSKYTDAKFIGLGYSLDEIRREDDPQKMAVGKQEVKEGVVELNVEDDTFEIPMWQCNIETDSIPLDDNSVDVVVFTETLEHLLFDASLVFAEMNRVLKPGGKLIFSTPNNLYWARTLQLIFGRNIDDAYSVHGPYGRHNRNYTIKEAKILAGVHGFKCTEMTSHTFLPLNTSTLKKLVNKIAEVALFWSKNRKGKTMIGVFEKEKHVAKPEYPGWLYH